MRTPTANELDYRRLKTEIDSQYPLGWFVGIADGRIVAASADFQALLDDLQKQGRDPRQVLVVEAGVTYPDYVTIFI